ncbi:unnamed protein product, partial [marine sediment metagenome]
PEQPYLHDHHALAGHQKQPLLDHQHTEARVPDLCEWPFA